MVESHARISFVGELFNPVQESPSRLANKGSSCTPFVYGTGIRRSPAQVPMRSLLWPFTFFTMLRCMNHVKYKYTWSYAVTSSRIIMGELHLKIYVKPMFSSLGRDGHEATRLQGPFSPLRRCGLRRHRSSTFQRRNTAPSDASIQYNLRKPFNPTYDPSVTNLCRCTLDIKRSLQSTPQHPPPFDSYASQHATMCKV